jgi:hypothetical protein
MTATRFLLKLGSLAAIAFLVGVTSTGVSANTITMANYNGGNGTDTLECTLSCEGFIIGAAPADYALSTTDAIDFAGVNSDAAELAKLNELLAGLDPARAPVTYYNKDDNAGGGFTTDRQYFSIKQAQQSFYFENTSGGTLTVDLGTANDYSHWAEYGAVSAVPVPAAAWLFGTALIGFIGFSRRTKV